MEPPSITDTPAEPPSPGIIPRLVEATPDGAAASADRKEDTQLPGQVLNLPENLTSLLKKLESFKALMSTELQKEVEDVVMWAEEHKRLEEAR